MYQHAFKSKPAFKRPGSERITVGELPLYKHENECLTCRGPCIAYWITQELHHEKEAV